MSAGDAQRESRSGLARTDTAGQFSRLRDRKKLPCRIPRTRAAALSVGVGKTKGSR